MSTDADLLRRYAADRCEAAFAELVRRYIGLVYGAALRQLRGNHPLAQEVTQDVFTLLARKAPALAADVILAAWLYSSTRFTVANTRRAEQRRQKREQEAYLMHDDLSRDPVAPSWETLRPVIDDIVQTLGHDDREAIVLRFFQGQPYAAIAATLQVNDDAVRRRVDRALEKLRAALNKRGFASSSSVLAALLINDTAAATPSGLAAMVSQHALAMSLSSGGAGTGFLAFMATSKTTLSALGLLAIIAGGVALHEHTANRTSEGDEAAPAREYQAALIRNDALKKSVSTADQALQKAESARTAKAATTAGTVPPPARIDPKEAGKEFIARHPEVLTALRQHTDAGTWARFGEMYRRLSMTPEEIQAFELLQREGSYFGRSMENGTIFIDPGTGLTSKEKDARIRDLLGPERMSQYYAYLTELPSRDIASNLSSLLVGTETPLTTDQARQVADLFAAQADRKGSLQFNWPAALAQAQSLLSPPQLEMLKAMQVRSQGWQQVLEATQKP